LCKYIVLYIYNIYSEHVYDTIIKKIDDIKNSTLYNLYNIVYLEQQRTININNLLYKNNIEKIIYEKIKDIKDIKDTDENIIKGLEGKIIKLPNIKIDKDEKHKIIFKSKINIKESDNIFEEHNYICQHNIDYKEINYIKRKDINLYSERLFIFIKKYAFIHNNTYICKSCNELLDIKRYIVNIHNLSGEEGININIHSNINLKDNLKYKNLGKLIEFIDKLVDKIALISNLTMFIGNNKETKFNRNKIIKKVIDLIIENYTLYIKLDKKEKEKKILDSQSYYGISLNYSNFFIFKLTEELFKFKSKDEDKYKKRKINNIILYIIFIILLELNKNHIINLSSDKLCNIILFNKYSKSIFENLNIRIDNSNSIKSLIKFPILCYYLYYFSCMIIKFKLWQFDDDNNKFDFIKVKIIIHSFVDMINHICENNILSKNNYIYEEIISLFYFKQKNIYDDILILKSIEEKQTNTINYNKIKNVITIIKNILPGIKLDGKLNLTYSTRKKIYICSNLIYRLKLKKEVDNTTYITKNENEEIYGIFKNNTFDKIVKYYDINNKSRSILLNDNQLKKIEKNIYNKIINDYEKVMLGNIIKSYEINSRNIINYKNKVNQFNTSININLKNNIESLDNFIKNLKNLYNNELFISKQKLFIVSDQYIINHDINGNYIEKSIYISDKHGKIITNHNIFKQDVLAITNNKYIMFYNLYTNLYLGFKDNYNTIINKKGKFLRINYSLRNLLLLIGLDHKYNNIKNINIRKHIYNNSKKRNNFLKNIITEFIKNINILKYYNKELYNTPIIKEYINKINKINLIKKDSTIIFDNYETISNNINYNKDFDYNIINDKYINIIDVIKNSNNDGLFYYYMNELNSLFELNNTNNNINIFKIFIEIILKYYHNNFNHYNTLNILLYKELMTFEKVNFFDDTTETEGIYNELKEDLTEEQAEEIKEQKYSDKESTEALDYEVNEDASSELGEDEELIQDLD